MTTTKGSALAVGTVVRDCIWGGAHTGTVVRAEGHRVFVAGGGAGSGSSKRTGPARPAPFANPAYDVPARSGRAGLQSSPRRGLLPGDPTPR